MTYTMAISKKTIRTRNLRFRSKDMSSGRILKIAAASTKRQMTWNSGESGLAI
jgi:hypothetical protein